MFIDFKSILNMAPKRMGLEPRSHVNQFQIDQNMAPERLRTSCQKKRLEKSNDPVDWKSTKSKKIPSLQNLDLDSFLSKKKEKES
jgi:hypothetical protein